MNQSSSVKLILKRLSDFRPDCSPIPRSLSLYSAAIAFADSTALENASKKALELGAGFDALYEILLQSYLFLGFPRMLIAAENLKNLYSGRFEDKSDSPAQFNRWYDRGLDLCQQVYAENFEKLRSKINSFAPDIFQWMILEGYGKVLSRPALDIKVRELAIVSCLMVENHPRQLHSHMRGALNVGVSARLMKLVIEDVGQAAGEGYSVALAMLEKAGISA